MTANIPGKVLIVDDERQDVAGLLDAFMQAGQGVIYLDRPPSLDRLPGVRLVVLDLDLDGDREVTDGDIEQAALVLQKLSSNGCGFYLIAIWSRHLDDGESAANHRLLEWLRDTYRIQTGHSLPSSLFLPPFSKKAVQQEEVMKRIAEWIRESPHAGLVFEWESLLDRARDLATSGIVDLEGGSLTSLIKVLRREVRESADRELMQLFNRVLLRYMTTGDLTEIAYLMDHLEESGDVNLEWYARFRYFQAYYNPEKNEPVWTGDIFGTDATDCREGYAVVVTSQCDLAQGKVDRIKVAYAMKVDDNHETQRQVFAIVKPGKIFYRQDGELTNGAMQFLAGVAGQEGLPERFYVLRFVRVGELHFHLLVDLHNVHSVPLAEIEEIWKDKRICRLDSPYIEDLMHRYAALSERVGVPAIPEEVCEAEAKRLKGV